MQKFISTYVAEFIAGIEVVESKSTKCDCGETYILVTDNDEYVVCDACADFYNSKSKMKPERFVRKWEADFIADIEPVLIKKATSCKCGETYGLVFPGEILIVCDACAEIHNDKKIVK
jgi:hypothetical protein